MGRVIDATQRFGKATGSWQRDMEPATFDEVLSIDYLPSVDHTHEYDEAFLASIGLSKAPALAVPCTSEPTHSEQEAPIRGVAVLRDIESSDER